MLLRSLHWKRIFGCAESSYVESRSWLFFFFFGYDEKFSVKLQRVVITPFRAHKECQWSRKSSFHAVAHITFFLSLTKKKTLQHEQETQKSFFNSTLGMNSSAREERKKSEINKSQQVIVIHYVQNFFFDVFINVVTTRIRMNLSRAVSNLWRINGISFLFTVALCWRYVREVQKRIWESEIFGWCRLSVALYDGFHFAEFGVTQIWNFFLLFHLPLKWNEMSLWTYMEWRMVMSFIALLRKRMNLKKNIKLNI